MKKNKGSGRGLRKSLLVIASVVLVACIAIAGSTAWLTASTQKVTNSFTPGKVTSEVIETTAGKTKSDVKVKNTGNVDAYVRATVVCNWVDKDGNVVGYYDKTANPLPTPVLTGDWFAAGEYFYCKTPVKPGDSTPVMLNPITEENAPEGCHLQVTILAEAIQAQGVGDNGTAAVSTVWPVTVDTDGQLKAN